MTELTPEEYAALSAAEAAGNAARAIRDEHILDAIATTATPPAGEGEAWVAPAGAHNAYALGARVTHGGKTWINLTPFNAHEPGVSGWREETTEGYPAWVQPAGAHDAYWPSSAGDVPPPIVTHNGQTWRATVRDNVWPPGVHGWELWR